MIDLSREYLDRINVLMSSAAMEGIRARQSSLRELARFIRYVPYRLKVGSLFLLNDGTFSAVWRNDRWRLNLTFCVDATIEYVLLQRDSSRISGDAGQLTNLRAFDELSEKYDLRSLLGE